MRAQCCPVRKSRSRSRPRVGSIGAYGPVAERIKVHCFFAKTVGTVPVFVGSVPFSLCRVNAPKGPYRQGTDDEEENESAENQYL